MGLLFLGDLDPSGSGLTGKDPEIALASERDVRDNLFMNNAALVNSIQITEYDEDLPSGVDEYVELGYMDMKVPAHTLDWSKVAFTCKFAVREDMRLRRLHVVRL